MNRSGGAAAVLITGVILAALLLPGCRRWQSMPIEEKADKISAKLADELSLTKEQRAALALIKTDIVKKWKSRKERIARDSSEFIGLLKANALDKAKLKELAKRQGAARQEMQDFMIGKIIEFHGMLTPEQRKIAAGRLEKFRERILDNL